MSAWRHQSEDRWLTSVATPLIDLPKRHLLVDVIDACLRRFVLLVRAVTVSLVCLANVDSCPKMHEVVIILAAVGQRPKFLNELWSEERLDIVDRPRETPKTYVILRNQFRFLVKQKPHCSLEVRKFDLFFSETVAYRQSEWGQ